MADIDKGLPNTRTKLDIPSEEEMAEEVSVQEEEAQQKGPVEVVPEEDGGATIDFEPGAINIPGTENHFDNLADILPEENLEPIGNEMVQNYMDYKSSRKDWEQAYTTGLDLLGFKYETPSDYDSSINANLFTGIYDNLYKSKNDNPSFQNDLLSIIKENYLSFNCNNCGYSSKSYIWQCPSCNSWETIEPSTISDRVTIDG